MPNLEAAGLARKMKPLAALIDEQDRLRHRADELGFEQQRLEAEIKEREHARTVEWGRAIRAGEEAPTDDAIAAAKRRLEDVRKEIAAVRHAGELADAELKQTVAEHREEWAALVGVEGDKRLQEATAHFAKASEALAEVDPIVALRTWLVSGHYTPPSPVAISIDNLLHERRRDLGLLDVGAIG